MWYHIVLAQRIQFHFSSIRPVVCQKYVGIILELCLFETEKYCYLGGCIIGCIFLWSIIHIPCRCIPCLLLMLLYWSTTLHCNVQYCWTCVKGGCFLSLPIFLNLCFYCSLLYNPNPYWFRGCLIFCAHITAPFHHSQCQGCA